jgi:hypothetical protein
MINDKTRDEEEGGSLNRHARGNNFRQGGDDDLSIKMFR